MTRIIILCDGTWNSPDIVMPTHLVELSRHLVNDPRQGQVVAYFAGVGTDRRFDGAVGRFLNKWGGGAFGWGLDDKVKQAYQFIAKAYRRGDEIQVFGFSRGAYTARSVVGMIRKCGLIEDTSPAAVNRAFALYRKRGARNAPDAPHIREARRRMSPGFATSQEDLDWRGDGSELVRVGFVGVWDTVGARGIPLSLFGPVASLWNRQYRFHDMQLSRLVERARHAVALDEQRLFYRPALWDNLERQGSRLGLNGGVRGAARPYQQLWFIGTHGILGGSAGNRALSGLPLQWVVEGAPGIMARPGARLPGVPGDPLAETTLLPRDEGLLRRWREGPERMEDIHPSVSIRVQTRAKYRPGSLRL